MAEKIIGIDLGTTNSKVAVVESGRVTIIDITPGQPTTCQWSTSRTTSSSRIAICVVICAGVD